jgi:hypothetical protein
MMRTFVESRGFTGCLGEFLGDEGYRRFQRELASNPDKGDVMPGCGGLRKVRVGDESRGKGKRGGARVVYLDIPGAGRIDLIAIYGKDEQDDLTPQQKKVLAALAKKAKAEAVATARRGGKAR